MLLAHSYLHALMLVIIAIAMAEEKKCDLVGEEGSESPKELALLKRLEPLANKSFEAEFVSKDEHYIYKFKVCREASEISNSGLLQINKQSGEKTVVGRINETHLANGSRWIMLIYKGGDSYKNYCDKEKRKAIIMINCNRTTLAGGFTMLTEEREKANECFYIFELESSLACSPEDPHQSVVDSSHLSVGSILLITFATLAAVYIIGGFLYQRLVVGAKGIEQFPHFAFWQDLGNLVADGCDFVCRSKPRNGPAAYRGVGDDQLGEESEERDDHLLPM